MAPVPLIRLADCSFFGAAVFGMVIVAGFRMPFHFTVGMPFVGATVVPWAMFGLEPLIFR